MRYYCKNCDFKFEKEIKPERCPYCGEPKIEKEKSAEEFLKESRSS